LRDRIGRLEEMVAAVRLMIGAAHTGLELTPEERFALFGDFDFDGYAAAARERWGETEAFEEARRRTAGYGAADWRAIRSEAGDIEAELATMLSVGEPADGERVMDLAERHLGELYVADWRFTKSFEEVAAGLAEFFRDAIVANAERVEES
jgi:MerR family transcriptional regulator, thiopeptide resistance regulator